MSEMYSFKEKQLSSHILVRIQPPFLPSMKNFQYLKG